MNSLRHSPPLCPILWCCFWTGVNTFWVSKPAPDRPHSLDLARNLTALRTAGEWSMRALADQAHISEGMLLHLEKARMNPSLSTIEKLAQALGVQAGSLFGKRPVARQGPEIFIETIVAQNSSQPGSG